LEWPLRPSSGADTYYHHVVHALVRRVSSGMTPSLLQS
jgi:hypothetical protein